MSDDELGDIFGETILNKLQGITGEKNGIPLCMVINIYCISFLEGAGRKKVLGGYEKTVLDSNVCCIVAYCAQEQTYRQKHHLLHI
jgi:hypothetical protein